MSTNCPSCGFPNPDTQESSPGVFTENKPKYCRNCGRALPMPEAKSEAPSATIRMKPRANPVSSPTPTPSPAPTTSSSSIPYRAPQPQASTTPLEAPKFETSSPIHWYFNTVWTILTKPFDFYKTMPTTGGVSAPIAFALVTKWVGTAVEYLWFSLMGGLSHTYFEQVVSSFQPFIQRPGMGQSIKAWAFGIGPVILDPFFTLFSLVTTAAVVYLGAILLINKMGAADAQAPEPTYENILRILCYGMTPALLAVVPFVGSVAAGIYTMVVSVIGAMVVFRIHWARAAGVILFPKLIMMVFVLGIVMLFAFLMATLFAVGSGF